MGGITSTPLPPASTAIVDAGASNSEAVTPDSLAESYAGTKPVQLDVFDFTADMATGDGKFYFRVPGSMGGMNLIGVNATVITAGTTGTADIQVHNVTQAADMLSTEITIDTGETDSADAATPPVIDTANDDVAEGDMLRIDVDAIHTTPAKGLIVTLTFRLP